MSPKSPQREKTMQESASAKTTDGQTTLEGLAAPRTVCALAAAGAGVALVGLVLAFFGTGGLQYCFCSYLVSFCFFLSISLGALFFVLLQHVTRAGWSVTVRRLAEILAANVILFAALFLPILLVVVCGGFGVYEWADGDTVAGDHLLEHKRAFLNVPFFVVRSVLYLAVWTLLARYYLSRSLQQDESGDPAVTLKMERLSGPALLLFAFSITFAAFDWLMSLEAHWFSTIFGVYYFSGAAVGFLAAVILAAIGLQGAGRLKTSITTEHYHDLGKLLFGFIVFWGYIAFSQYLLIWYANIPEETGWYRDRQTGLWVWLTVGLLLGHLFIPFLGLISREVKRRKPLLAFWAVWILAFHWFDLYWLVMPSFWHRIVGASAGDTSAAFSPALGAVIDLCLLVGLGCLYVAGAGWIAGNRSLVPRKDPRLSEALEFESF
ncbi:MAG: quinol:cytochrome C oxidoreductase [Planctomycetota bacterium]|jgi:hypothetical protein